jgi:CRP/FNR family cyclic AMP-dependent transcriptional regulator
LKRLDHHGPAQTKGILMKIDTTVLAAQPFLKGLSRSQLKVLANSALEVEFPAGKLIFQEGESANRFYILLDGEVSLESGTEKSARQIQKIHAHDVLGWSWLFPPHQWSFNARAVKPTKAIIFLASSLRESCERDNTLGYEL